MFRLVELIGPKTVCVAPIIRGARNLYTTFVLFIPDIILCQQSLDGDQKGKYYGLYYDEGRYWGRFLNVKYFHYGLCVKGSKFCWLYFLDYIIEFS